MEECTLGKMDRKYGMQVSDGISKTRFCCETGNVERSLEGYGPLSGKESNITKHAHTTY